MAVVLLLGGVRSGKSRLAAELADGGPAPVTMIATAEARDEEMSARITRHRAERPADWATVEAPVELADAIEAAPSDHALVVDCLTLWVSNLIEHGLHDDEIVDRAQRAAGLAAQRDALVVVVSNEVGSGVIASSELGRRYVDVLGRVNAIWAHVAQRAALVVAGKVLPLHGREVLAGD